MSHWTDWQEHLSPEALEPVIRPVVSPVQRWLKRLHLSAALLVLGIATLAALRGSLPAAPEFAVAPPQPRAATAIKGLVPTSRSLPQPDESAHSVTLSRLPDGQVGAMWFSGSREGAADVRIVFSRFDGRDWSPPRTVVNRGIVQRDTGRLIRKIGNPVLWMDSKAVLHLWFVSVSYGGWAGSAINQISSKDGGLGWSPVERIVTSPFINISTLVRNPPLPLTDGGIALPVYHEFISKHPEWLRFDERGRLLGKSHPAASSHSLQPAAVALDGLRAVMLLRDAGPLQRIRASASDDGGRHWSSPVPTALPNSNAGIALLRLADGRLLLAYNPQTANRNRLGLSVSGDEGRHWSPPWMIEDGAEDDEYSYPALLQDEQGDIHLAYTWKRQRIQHLRFSPEALPTIPAEEQP